MSACPCRGIWTAQARANCLFVPVSVRGILPENSRIKYSCELLCAFRLRRLAQSLPREPSLILACGSLLENSRIKFWHVHVHFNCAGSRKTVFPVSGRDLFPANSRIKTGSCDISMCILTAQTRAKSLPREISLIFVCGIVLENFRIKWLLWHVHVPIAQACAKRLSRS